MSRRGRTPQRSKSTGRFLKKATTNAKRAARRARKGRRG